MNRWSIPAVVSLMALSISPSIAEGIIETPPQITTGVSEYAAKPPRDFADVQLASVGTARSQVVAINPKNPSALVVAYSNKGSCWVRSSNNAGQTWTGAKMLRMPPGKLNCDTVALVWAPNGGRIYAAYSYGIWDVFWDSRGAGAVFSSSTDNGLTWSNPKIAVSYPYETYRINSLKLSVAPLSSGKNWIYLISEIINVVAIHSNISRSEDHGQTWSPEKNLIASYYSSTDPTSPSIAAGPRGEVIVAWGETRYPEYSDPPELPVSRVYIRRSGDYGSNFSNDLIVVPDTRAATAVAFGAFGTAHIIYTVDEPSALGAYYVYSTKAPYASWSAPVALNEVSSANRYLAPALASAPAEAGQACCTRFGWTIGQGPRPSTPIIRARWRRKAKIGHPIFAFPARACSQAMMSMTLR